MKKRETLAMVKEIPVSMIITGGIMIVGRYLRGENKILKPRVLEEIVENELDPVTKMKKAVPKMHIKPFPSCPPFVTIGNNAISYVLTTREGGAQILDLYGKVTHPLVDPG